MFRQAECKHVPVGLKYNDSTTTIPQKSVLTGGILFLRLQCFLFRSCPTYVFRRSLRNEGGRKWLHCLVEMIVKTLKLLVCTWRHGGHVGGQEQKHFSPLGTKLYFHVNSSRKYSFVLTPNMAALSRGCKPRILRSHHRKETTFAAPVRCFSLRKRRNCDDKMNNFSAITAV